MVEYTLWGISRQSVPRAPSRRGIITLDIQCAKQHAYQDERSRRQKRCPREWRGPDDITCRCEPASAIGADAPLRAELLSTERLADEARAIAARQRWTTAEPPRTTPLIALTERAAESLAADNRELAGSAVAGFAASPAGEWLLDNYYLIEEQVLLVRQDLPPRYGIELPRLQSGDVRRIPSHLRGAADAGRPYGLTARRVATRALHRWLPERGRAHDR